MIADSFKAGGELVNFNIHGMSVTSLLLLYHDSDKKAISNFAGRRKNFEQIQHCPLQLDGSHKPPAA